VPKTVYYSRRRGTTNHTGQRGVEPETSRTIVIKVTASLLQPAHAPILRLHGPESVTVKCQQVVVGLGMQGNVRSLCVPPQNIRLCAWAQERSAEIFGGPGTAFPRVPLSLTTGQPMCSMLPLLRFLRLHIITNPSTPPHF